MEMEKMDLPPSYASTPYSYPQPPPEMPQPMPQPMPQTMPPPSMPLPSHAIFVTSEVAFSKENQNMICSHCHANITTRVQSEANMKTHLMAVLLCLFGCCCCAPCPYCIDSCLIHKHFCPACNSFLGASEN